MWKGSGAKRRYVSKNDEMMYVPLLDTLQNILKSDDMISEVHHNVALWMQSYFAIIIDIA